MWTMKPFVAAALAGLLLAFAPISRASAQSADLVLCDGLAADPSDPDRPADARGTAEIAKADIATAIKFCRTAGSGLRRALYQLGGAYAANGQMTEAMAAWRKAADKGSTSAIVELGVMYGTGNGVARDEAQARKLFERAAEAGNPRGVANLAAASSGASADPARGRALLAKAAETNPEAQYQLGMMLAEGSGGPKDEVGARPVREGGGENLLRAFRGARQRRSPGRAEAAGMPLRAEGQARQRRQQSVLLIAPVSDVESSAMTRTGSSAPLSTGQR